MKIEAKLEKLAEITESTTDQNDSDEEEEILEKIDDELFMKMYYGRDLYYEFLEVLEFVSNEIRMYKLVLSHEEIFAIGHIYWFYLLPKFGYENGSSKFLLLPKSLYVAYAIQMRKKKLISGVRCVMDLYELITSNTSKSNWATEKAVKTTLILLNLDKLRDKVVDEKLKLTIITRFLMEELGIKN
jgi:hypothetical protein